MSAIRKYKTGFFYSQEFVKDNSWNGYEHNLMFESLGNGQFVDVARPLGCDNIEDSRGVAVADINSDGRQDLVISNNADPPVIYLNEMSSSADWTRFDLTDSITKNVYAIGARVEVTLVKDSKSRTLTRTIESGSGFASQSELTVHFGLGRGATIEAVTVVWPNGVRQRLPQESLSQLLNSRVGIRRDLNGLTILPSRNLKPNSTGVELTSNKELKP